MIFYLFTSICELGKLRTECILGAQVLETFTHLSTWLLYSHVSVNKGDRSREKCPWGFPRHVNITEGAYTNLPGTACYTARSHDKLMGSPSHCVLKYVLLATAPDSGGMVINMTNMMSQRSHRAVCLKWVCISCSRWVTAEDMGRTYWSDHRTTSDGRGTWLTVFQVSTSKAWLPGAQKKTPPFVLARTSRSSTQYKWFKNHSIY